MEGCEEILELQNKLSRKNQKGDNVVEEKFGARIYLKFKETVIIITGYFKDELINGAYTQSFLRENINL